MATATSSSGAVSAEDIVDAVVARRIAPNAEAAVAVVAGTSVAIRDALLRVRSGPGGAPLPDHGACVIVPRVAQFVRLPPQPSSSAAAHYRFDVVFDRQWLDARGLRQTRAALPPPAGLRRVEVTGREVPAVLTGRLFASADAVRAAFAATFAVAAELAVTERKGDAAMVYPGLGVFRVAANGIATFSFAEELEGGRTAASAALQASQRRTIIHDNTPPTLGDRWETGSVASSSAAGARRPGSAAGSAMSVARSLSRPSSAAGRPPTGGKRGGGGVQPLSLEALDRHNGFSSAAIGGTSSCAASDAGGAGAFPQYGSVGRSHLSAAPSPARSGGSAGGFRRPNPDALQRVMDAAVMKELDDRRRRAAEEAAFAARTAAATDVADVADSAVRQRQRGQREAARDALRRQAEERRRREAAELADRRAPTPVVFPYSDQEGQRERTRRLAREQREANLKETEHRRAASRQEARRDWAEGAESAARERSDAARMFLDQAAARREQRQQLQEAWKAQIALRYAD